jgi:hypothetical protein
VGCPVSLIEQACESPQLSTYDYSGTLKETQFRDAKGALSSKVNDGLRGAPYKLAVKQSQIV